MSDGQTWYKLLVTKTVAIRAPSPEEAYEIAEKLVGQDDYGGWEVLREEVALNEPEPINPPLSEKVGMFAVQDGHEE